MVQAMEAWFLADREELKEFYGRDFRSSALSPRRDIENIPKRDLYSGLQAATADCRKGEYSKGEHSFQILARIDPANVRAASAGLGRAISICAGSNVPQRGLTWRGNQSKKFPPNIITKERTNLANGFQLLPPPVAGREADRLLTQNIFRPHLVRSDVQHAMFNWPTFFFQHVLNFQSIPVVRNQVKTERVCQRLRGKKFAMTAPISVIAVIRRYHQRRLRPAFSPVKIA
jgi:hypothetical protein